MSSPKKRLDDLDDYLSPTEIVLRWLQEVSRMGSWQEYAASLRDSTETETPLERLTGQARRAAVRSTEGMSQDTIDKTVREYVRDVVYLLNLYVRVNARISGEFRVTRPMIAALFTKLHSRWLVHDQRSDAAYAWVGACRDLPYPLDAETAATVGAAVVHQVESWVLLRETGTIEDWVLEDLRSEDDDEVSGESLDRISRSLERELRRLVRSGQIKAGKVLSLPAVPHPFLSSAPLLDGRWIDVTALELAELGMILCDRGCTLRGSRDLRPLAWDEFVRTDTQGELAPIDDASWHQARESAKTRVRGYRGRRRVFTGRDYVEFALYQKWRARAHGARLEASTLSGFIVSDWNDWVKNRGLKAVLAGIRVEPIEPWCDEDSWSVHDPASARRLQAARKNLLAQLRSAARGGEVSTAASGEGNEAGVPSRAQALLVLTLVDGLAAAVEGIRSTYFRNSEIVFTELVEDLDGCRTAIREVLEIFEEQRDWGDPLLERLGVRSRRQDGYAVTPDHEDRDSKEIEDLIVRTGKRIAADLVREARFDALVSIGEEDAARRIIDEELDELLS